MNGFSSVIDGSFLVLLFFPYFVNTFFFVYILLFVYKIACYFFNTFNSLLSFHFSYFFFDFSVFFFCIQKLLISYLCFGFFSNFYCCFTLFACCYVLLVLFILFFFRFVCCPQCLLRYFRSHFAFILLHSSPFSHCIARYTVL